MDTTKGDPNLRNSKKKEIDIKSIYGIDKTLPELNVFSTFSLKHSYEIVCNQLAQIPRDDIVIFISPTADLVEKESELSSAWSSFPSKIKNMNTENEKQLLFNIICFSNKIINEIQKQTSNSFCFLVNEDSDKLFIKDLFTSIKKNNYSEIKEKHDLLNYLNINYDNVSKKLFNITKQSVNEVISLCYDLIENEILQESKQKADINNKEIIYPEFLRIILFKDSSSFNEYTNKEIDKTLKVFSKGRYVHYMGVTVNLFPFPRGSEHYKKVEEDPDKKIYDRISDTAVEFRKDQYSQIEEILKILQNKEIDIQIQYENIKKEMNFFDMNQNKQFVELLEKFDNKILEINNLINYIVDQNTNIRKMHVELKNNIQAEMKRELNDNLEALQNGLKSIKESIDTKETLDNLQKAINIIDTQSKEFIKKIPEHLNSSNIWKAKITYMNKLHQLITNFNNRITNLTNFIEYIANVIKKSYPK